MLQRGAPTTPTDEVSAAWGVKGLLRQMRQAHGRNGYSRHQTSTRRTRFLLACVAKDMPETTRLAATIERWWPEIEGFLELGNTNARTEGYNHVIRQLNRVACGFRDQEKYERRITHSAARRVACTASGRGFGARTSDRRRPMRFSAEGSLSARTSASSVPAGSDSSDRPCRGTLASLAAWSDHIAASRSSPRVPLVVL